MQPADPPNPFDELFALVRPEVFMQDPRANGEGIAVCIIDSGLDQRVLQERARARGQPLQPIEGGIFLPDRPEPLPSRGPTALPMEPRSRTSFSRWRRA